MDKDKNEVIDKHDIAIKINLISYKGHFDTLLAAGSAYDRAILGLSTASLGFTFALIRGLKTISCVCLLYFIWFFLILSIIFTLIAFFIYQHNAILGMEKAESKLLLKPRRLTENKWVKISMENLPLLAGIFFILAIALFSIFVGINIPV